VQIPLIFSYPLRKCKVASLAGVPKVGGSQQPDRFVVREADLVTYVCVTLGEVSY
jgi:hypothetical protein